MGFSDAQIEELRDRADLVALIGRRVGLKKAGSSHVGLCPFHGERTPSFNVIPAKRMWHCFGCQESGDIFKFYMKLDGLAFPDAVRQVAAESGILLTEERDDPQAAARRAHEDRLAALLERATKFYEEKLNRPGGRIAREHLEKRGISAESIKRFRLGFGGGMEDLARGLERAGVPADQAIETGLCIRSERTGRLFDRFHGRLIVPIRVPRPPDGRVVALGGRHLEGVEPERPGRTVAKYINSPETPLYHKGSVLYGLELAREPIRREGKAVVVEGYFDVIGLHQEGMPLAVATCGTSLSEAHLELLLRAGAKEIVFLFDGDAAGVRAATRAAELCAKARVPARVASLPGGMDPDEFAREKGLATLQALLSEARPAVERLIDHALEGLGPAATVEERVRAVQAVAGIVRNAPAGLSRDLYVGQIAARLGVPEAAVREALTAPAPPVPGRPSGASARAGGPRAGEPGPDEGGGPAEEAALDGPPAEDAGEARPARRMQGGGGRGTPSRRGGGDETAAGALAGRTQELEEVVAVALLKYPSLAKDVAEQGVLADFADPALRSLADRVLAAAQSGEPVDAAGLVAELPDARLRGVLSGKLADDDGSLDDYAARLARVMDRLRQEIRRQRAREVLLAQQRGELPDDEEARRALLEQQQKLLEEARRVHTRIRERNRDGSGS